MGFDISKGRCRAIRNRFNPPVFDNYSLMKDFNANRFDFSEEDMKCLPPPQEVMKLVTNISQEFYLQSVRTIFLLIQYANNRFILHEACYIRQDCGESLDVSNRSHCKSIGAYVQQWTATG